MGIMMGCPQRLQGSVESGGRSPGMKTLASHPGQVTIFKLPLVLILLSTWFGKVDRHARTVVADSAAANLSCVSCFVTPRQSRTRKIPQPRFRPKCSYDLTNRPR